MKNFELSFPASVDQAIELLPEGGDWSDAPARLLAGGQDLLPEMKEHLVEPDLVVNLKRIPELAQVVPSNGGLQLGALVTLAAVGRNENVRAMYPVVAEAADSHVGAVGRVVQPRLFEAGGEDLTERLVLGDQVDRLVGPHAGAAERGRVERDQ